MFAPRAAKTQAKPAASPTNRLAPPYAASVGRAFDDHTAQEADSAGLTAEAARPGVSWDFGKISIFAADRAPESPQRRVPGAPPIVHEVEGSSWQPLHPARR